MKAFRATVLLVALCFSVPAAHAGVINFSDVVIDGSLAGGASFATGDNYIDFFFPDASVGDGLPLRIGTLSMTYVAESIDGMYQNQMLLSVLGALQGSGTIFFNEVIEDISDPLDPVFLASYGVVLDSNSDLPHTAVLDFARPSNKIKVKKNLTLTAFDTAGVDFANVGLVEQTIRVVPEPASLGLIGLGLLCLFSRRVRKTA
jgi:hypothetical protein